VTDPEGALLVIEPRPTARRAWFAELWRSRAVFSMLARKDFQTRYKRASFGVLWAVVVPLLQGLVMAVVFSRVVPLDGDSDSYAAYVFAGIVAYSYFSATLGTGSTAIVEGAGLTDKVWFPRVLLVGVPAAANAVSLSVSLLMLLVLLPVLGGSFGVATLLFVPGVVLLVAFTTALTMVVAALHVYFRDVKFLVQAALLVWIYITPVLYPKDVLGDRAGWVDLNPLTGIIGLFQRAALGEGAALGRPLAISIAAVVVLAVAGLEGQRRHDRLFVDLL
jgi:ABC-type polysaccharide/polyol phosphate export permease